MKRYHLTIAGGGATYTPGIVNAILNARDVLPLRKLVLLDHSEYSLYAIDHELQHAAAGCEIVATLGSVLDALEADHEFLLKGGVFTPDLLEEYINYKRVHEVDPIRLRPTPHEFVMYFDA